FWGLDPFWGVHTHGTLLGSASPWAPFGVCIPTGPFWGVALLGCASPWGPFGVCIPTGPFGVSIPMGPFWGLHPHGPLLGSGSPQGPFGVGIPMSCGCPSPPQNPD
uniref:Uncharacterized protein n=1 Tax=Zonotrichia albicollis TaxID=44394 RepID=A0A8D2MWF5_ZONAL